MNPGNFVRVEGVRGFKSPQLRPNLQVKDLLIFSVHRPEDYLLAARWREHHLAVRIATQRALTTWQTQFCSATTATDRSLYTRVSSSAGRADLLDTARKFAVFTAPPQFTVLSGRQEIGWTDPMLRTERPTARARPAQVERGAQGDAHRRGR
jgi:hypothetical protein